MTSECLLIDTCRECCRGFSGHVRRPVCSPTSYPLACDRCGSLVDALASQQAKTSFHSVLVQCCYREQAKVTFHCSAVHNNQCFCFQTILTFENPFSFLQVLETVKVSLILLFSALNTSVFIY